MVHGDRIDERRWTVMLHVIRVTVTGCKPLVLDGSLRLVVEIRCDLLLLLVVDVLILEVAQDGLVGFGVVQLLLCLIALRVVANLLVVRNDDSFGLEFGCTFHIDTLVGSMHLELLCGVDLGICLGLNVSFVVDGVTQVPNMVPTGLQMIWHCHLGRDTLRSTESTVQHVALLATLTYVIKRLCNRRVHPFVTCLLQGTFLRSRSVLK